jgi:hypothetical protein
MTHQRRKSFHAGQWHLPHMAVALACLGAAALGLSAPVAAATISAWSIVTSPNVPGAQFNVLSNVSCSGPTNCMAVGWSAVNGASPELTLTEHWNGSTWAVVSSPNVNASTNNVLNDVACPSANACVAVGYSFNGTNQLTLTEWWNGTTWAVVPSPNPSPTHNLLAGVACTSVTNCVAVGSTGNGPAQTLVESWNGSAWSVVPSPNGPGNNFMGSVSCPLPTSCMALGSDAGGPLFESWNGSAWSIVPSPNVTGALSVELNDVTCTNPSFCVAVGDQNVAAMSYPSLVEMWNGTSWSIVPSPSMPSSDENVLDGVSCTDPANCVATGHWSDVNDTVDQTFIERWDGTAWSIVPSPNTSPTLQNDLAGVTCSAGTQCIAMGDATTAGGQSPTLILATPVLASGSYEVASDGGLFAYHAPFYGSMGGKPLNKPIVGMAYDPATGGYWEVASDGGIFAFNAPFYGSMGGKPLNKPIVGMAYDPATGGYWEVASDGGIFAFNATFHGSMGGTPLVQPVVGIAALADGSGYYEVASDGGLFAFGAPFQGSMGGKPLNKPIVGMAVDQATGGYYEVASDGGLFAFGAPFQGSMGGKPLNKPVVGMAVQPDGSGYWEVASDGGLFAFNAPFFGSAGGMPINQPVVGMTTS